MHLPGKVVEVEGDHGKYDVEKKVFSFTLKKVTPGQHFDDLDLIGKLLIPNKKHQLKPEISVNNEEGNNPMYMRLLESLSLENKLGKSNLF